MYNGTARKYLPRKTLEGCPRYSAPFVNIGLRKNGFLHVSDAVGPAKVHADGVGEEPEDPTTA